MIERSPGPWEVRQ